MKIFLNFMITIIVSMKTFGVITITTTIIIKEVKIISIIIIAWI